MSEIDIDPEDTSMEAEEARKTYRRRLFTYTPKALAAALPVERVFVTHPAFKAALEAFDRIYQLSPASAMPHGMRLIGDTGTGKSSLIRYYKDSMPPSRMFELDAGALSLRMQERPNIGRLVSTLLRLLHYPFSQVSKNTVSLKKDIVIDAMKQKGTHMIFVDEAHHMCNVPRHVRSGQDGTEITEFLRELMDECRVGLVLSGTKALDGLRDLDGHLHSRVSARFELVNFDAPVQFQGFVKAFGSRCKTFDLSGIHGLDLTKRWLIACHGNPRAFKRLVVEGILVATDAGRADLDLPSLALAFDRVAGRNSLASNPFSEGEA